MTHVVAIGRCHVPARHTTIVYAVTVLRLGTLLSQLDAQKDVTDAESVFVADVVEECRQCEQGPEAEACAFIEVLDCLGVEEVVCEEEIEA
jgi:hypothetical protein